VAKKFYRDLEQMLNEIDVSTDAEDLLRAIVRRLMQTLREPYGIESGRVYREREDDYQLIESIGEFGDAIAGKSIPKSYPIINEIERHRLVLISPDSAGFDPELEAQFTHLDNVAILVGAHPAFILSLGLRHTESEEALLVMLETIRATVGLKLQQGALENQLRQARTIQLSLLPRRLPRLEGFQLAAATYPADEVGGDIYDVQRLDTGVISIAVADASGHGLPAALQARDIVTGLRMGVARDQKIPATIQRLNRVIHQSGLTSRFISLFYGEVEENGNIFYVNCGHCPPLVFHSDGSVDELPSSGPVLGPLPSAHFRRCYTTMEPGDYLVLFSDGVTERKPPTDDEEELEEFGLERLMAVCRKQLGQNAKSMVQAVTKAVREFGGGAPWEDDVTIMVLRRLPAGQYQPQSAPGAVQVSPPPA
jgi:sigma-B regulation protein RsbU (phosphoserine phosphatase)